MRRFATLALVVLGVGAPAPCRAGIYLRVPFFTYSADYFGCPGGVGVAVHVPGLVEFQLNGGLRLRRAAYVGTVPAPAPVEELPEEAASRADRFEPPPPRPLTVVNKPLTVPEFARSFQPAAGSYETTLVHPLRQNPVTVRFTLPEGTPRQIRVRRGAVVFDYGRHLVRIRFLRDGSVRVVSR